MSTLRLSYSWHLHPRLKDVGPSGRDLYLLLCCLAQRQGSTVLDCEAIGTDALAEYTQQSQARVVQILADLHDAELIGLQADGEMDVGGCGVLWS